MTCAEWVIVCVNGPRPWRVIMRRCGMSNCAEHAAPAEVAA